LKHIFQEVVGYLNHEVNFYLDLSPSEQLGTADTCRKNNILQKKTVGIADITRYNVVIHELATTAFMKYIRSKFYKGWRAHESGTLQSLRGQLIMAVTDASVPVGVNGCRRAYCNSGIGTAVGYPDIRLISGSTEMQADNSVNCSIFCDSDDTRSINATATQFTMVSRSASEPSAVLRPCHHMQRHDELASPVQCEARAKGSLRPSLSFSSFTDAAFARTTNYPQDRELLLSSTWLATLVAGMDGVSIGFSLLSTSEPELTHMRQFDLESDRNDPKFVYVNHQFERDFGYGKHELVGNCYEALFSSAYLADSRLTLDKSEMEFTNIIRSGVDGNMALTLRRKNGRHTRTFLCTKVLYNQRGQRRYVITLSVNIPVNCRIYYGKGSFEVAQAVHFTGNVNEPETEEAADTAHLIAQFNSCVLIELLALLPAIFVDDGLLQDGTTVIV
jgi:PAS domain-containing protein